MAGHMSKTFETWRVEEIKKFLRELNQLVSGNKAELVDRARGCVALRICGEKNSKDELFHRPNFDKLTTPSGAKMPDPAILKDWLMLEAMPSDVKDTDVYNYFVLSRLQTIDNREMGASRQLKGRTMFIEGHVQSIAYNPIRDDCDHCFIQARVMPSLPSKVVSKTPDYTTWICLSKISGHIHSAHCTCTAGEGGSCNHVAVALCEKKKNGLTACTSQPCTWSVPKRNRITSPKKVTERPLWPLKRVMLTSPIVNFSRLRHNLSLVEPNSGYVLTTAQSSEFRVKAFLLPDVEYNFKDSTDLKTKTCTDIFEKYVLNLPSFDITQIERETRGQASNSLWRAIRQGRLTSSSFGKIYYKRDKTAVDNILKEVLGYRSVPDVPAVKWGRSHEAVSRVAYVKYMQKEHPGLQVEECGLFMDKNNSFLAASPDGIVICCNHCFPSVGLVEIKCPFTHRDLTVKESCENKAFFCAIENNSITLKRSHHYFCQIQGQMGITGKPWVDFVVWTLKDLHVERIYFGHICRTN